MKRVIAVCVVFLFVLSFAAVLFAQNPAGTPPAPGQKTLKGAMTVEERKARLTALFDERIKILQEAKVCVAAAKTVDDIRKCRQTIKAENKELREDIKQGKK